MTRFKSLRAAACTLLAVVFLTVLQLVAPTSAQATMVWSTAARNAELNGLVTTLGGSATCRFYNGTRPASLGSITSQTLLATLTFGSTAVTDANGGTAGSVTGGVLTFGGYTQTSRGFTAGTPTWLRCATRGGTAVVDIDVSSSAGSGVLQFTGSIAVGQNITGTLTITAGNVGP